ncbi:MAG: hypothetical protein KF740_07130, partial [Ramlibacter sp.]|nr:hypothetical protein [Ramlibacter sp.]
HPDTGQPLGVGAGDPRAAYNAFVHQQTRWVLANYRDAPGIIDCNGNGIDDAIDLATGSSSDANGDCRPDECDERRYADAQTPGPGEGRAWANAGADLRELLDLAYLKCSNIKEIWVADGIYTPARWPGDRFGSFRLTSGLAMHGGFQGKSRIGGGETSLAQRIAGSHASILSGEIDGPGRDDNSYSVVTAYAADEHSLVDRFTIQHGYSDWYGAGVYLEGSSTRFTDCLFQENRAGSGGALAAWWGGSPSLHRCALMDNTAVGGGGGGLSFNAGVHLTVEQSEFRGNHAWWGGALAAGDSSAEIRASVFSGNAADVYNGGAIDLYNTQAVIAGCLITKNHAVGDAGGIWSASGTTASIINCTLADNTTDEYTGGLVVFFAAADVVNSILWGHNGSYQDEQSRNLLYFAATGGVNYSRVAGWAGDLGGLANSGEDPYFADPSAGDYSLSYGSSCIDAGDSSALPAGLVVDAAGNPRRADDHSMPDTGPGDPPVVDLGALERVPCKADFDGSGFVDLDDYIAFVFAFEEGVDEADFDGTGFVDTDDFTAFVLAFEQGC